MMASLEGIALKDLDALKLARGTMKQYVEDDFPQLAPFFDRIWEASVSTTRSFSGLDVQQEPGAIPFAGDDLVLQIVQQMIPFVLGVFSSITGEAIYRRIITNKERATAIVEKEAEKVRITVKLDEESTLKLIPYIVHRITSEDHIVCSPLHLEDMLDDKLHVIYKQVSQDKDVIDLLVQIQNAHPSFTSHGTEHSEAIIRNLEKLLPRDIWNCFTGLEILILLCSAWIHDVGMADFEGEMTDCRNENERRKLGKMIRNTHSMRSEKFITNPYNYRRLLLGSALAEIIGIICRMHANEYDLMKLKARWGPIQGYEEYSEIRVRLLAALLRLADACDLGYRRVKEVLITVHNIPRDHVESIPHIKGALLISGVVIKGRSLVVQAIPSNNEQKTWVDFLTRLLQEDFLSVLSVLKDKDVNGIEIPYDEVKLETLETG